MGRCSLHCQTADVNRRMYRQFAWRRKIQAIQRVPARCEVFAADFAVSEPTGADSTAAGGACEGSFECDHRGSNRVTGSRGGGAGEGRGDEATQYGPVALEVAVTIL